MKATPENWLLGAAVLHASELARYLRTQGFNAWDAEDLLQELYLAVLKVQRPESIQAPKAYLFTIASHLAHQYRERSKACPHHVPLEDVAGEVLDAVHPARDANPPESAAAFVQRWHGFTEKLSELSPEIRSAILWHHRDGYTCQEIAERLSIVRNRVKKDLVKGLAHCRRAGLAVGREASPTVRFS